MKVNIQSVKFDADVKLINFIEAKAEKLSRFFDRINSVDVILKIAKDEDNGNKVVVVTLDVPGDKLVAEKQSKSFEESYDECLIALKKQIEKYKAKL